MNIFKSKNQQDKRVVDFIYSFILRSKKSEIYKRKYRNLIRHIENFEQKTGILLYLNNLTESQAEEFMYYLKSVGRLKGKTKGTGLMINSVRVIKQNLDAVLRRAKSDGYSINADFLEVNVDGEDCNAIYLTADELKKINSVKLSKEMAAVRDMFLIGCFTALRFSDYSKLTTENIINEKIYVKTRKTGTKVIIPLHPIISEILKRNNGNFPKIKSEQAYNTALKRICKKAGINSEVLYERTIGLKVVRKRIKKYKLVSSHTARRSAATNMYLSGIPAARIMLITGHTTEQSFFKYIRIAKEENAKTLAESTFFLNI